MFISVIKSLLFYMSWILCKCRIHVNFSYLLQFCIQFLYPFSSTSNKFNRKNLCFFSLQKKSISKSDKKPVFEPPEIFSTKTYFPEPQGDKETEKEQTSEKNSWKMIFCLHEYIGCTKGAINAFQLYMYMIYSKFYLNLEVDWVVGIILQVPPTTDCRINKNSIIYM